MSEPVDTYSHSLRCWLEENTGRQPFAYKHIRKGFLRDRPHLTEHDLNIALDILVDFGYLEQLDEETYKKR